MKKAKLKVKVAFFDLEECQSCHVELTGSIQEVLDLLDRIKHDLEKYAV